MNNNTPWLHRDEEAIPGLSGAEATVRHFPMNHLSCLIEFHQEQDGVRTFLCCVWCKHVSFQPHWIVSKIDYIKLGEDLIELSDIDNEMKILCGTARFFTEEQWNHFSGKARQEEEAINASRTL